MKKYILIIVSIIMLTGCMNSKVDNLKNFKDFNSKQESYLMKGTMNIINNEDKFEYKIEVGVKDNKYYRVNLLNTINNHEQVILKNDDGVFVQTQKSTKQKLNVI